MLVYKLIKYRHKIIVTYEFIAILVCIMQGRSAVIADNHLVSIACALHILIVANVILRHNKGLFTRRQHNAALDHPGSSVSLSLLMRDIMQAYKHEALVIHLLYHLLKLRDGSHKAVVAACLSTPFALVKGILRIHAEYVKEHMRNLVYILLLQSCLGLLALCSKLLCLSVLIIVRQ